MGTHTRTSGILQLLRERGRDAMSFLAVESAMHHWVDDPPPGGTGACVAYVDAGEPVTQAYLDAGSWDVEIAGKR